MRTMLSHLGLELFFLAIVSPCVFTQTVDETFTYELFVNSSSNPVPTNDLPSCSDISLAIDGAPSWPLTMLTVPVVGYPNVQTIAEPTNGSTYFYLPYRYNLELSFWLYDSNGIFSPSYLGNILAISGTNDCTYTPTDKISFSTNATETVEDIYVLNACEVLEIFIEGGVPPYTVSIVYWDDQNAADQVDMMNIQIDAQTNGNYDNVLLWTNNIVASDGKANRTVRALVSDSNYNFAPGGDFITAAYVPSGYSCSATGALVSNSSSGSTASTTSSRSHSHLAAILAPILSVAFVVGLLVLAWMWMRKQRRIRLTETNKWKAKLDKTWKSDGERAHGGHSRFSSIASIEEIRREKESIDWPVQKV